VLSPFNNRNCIGTMKVEGDGLGWSCCCVRWLALWVYDGSLLLPACLAQVLYRLMVAWWVHSSIGHMLICICMMPSLAMHVRSIHVVLYWGLLRYTIPLSGSTVILLVFSVFCYG
jgi:hypothetical protein